MQTPAATGGEVLLLRAGEWRRLPVAAAAGGNKLPSSWSTHTTLPVGDALLCWANPYPGLILADVLAASPTPGRLRHHRRRGEVRECLPALLLRRRRRHPLPGLSPRLHHHRLDAAHGRHGVAPSEFEEGLATDGD
ncbi:hypothetical protein ACP4OV_014619 [Aristida adscensionis]